MKKSFLFLLFLLTSLFVDAQSSSKINNAQNVSVSVQNPPVLIGADGLPSGLWRVYIKDDIRWETYNINNFNSSVTTIGNGLYKPLSYTPNGSEIIAGLGYTPYNSSNPSNYISSENDPTVGSHIKSITTTNISNWNTAFGWGNHALGGYLTPSSSSNLTNKTGNISMWSNDSGYITSVSGSLGYTPIPDTRTITINGNTQDLSANRTWNVGDVLTTNSYSNPSWINSLAQNKITYTGTTSEYIRGNGSIATFPTLFSGDYNDLTNKPNLSDYYLASNPNGYISTLSFSALTGKPTTLSGYGITDAYPLTGNPSGFISSYTETDPIWTGVASSYRTKTQNDLLYQPIGSYLTSESDPLFDTKFAGKTTTNLTEGTNLYYTTGRFNTDFATKSTTNLTEGTNLYFTNNRARTAISLTTTGTSGVATYNNSTGVLNIPDYSQYTPTINSNVARSLNSNFTISTTKQARVSYSINVSWAIASLLSGTSTVYLEYSLNNGSTWIIANQVGKSIGLLTFSGADDMNLVGDIPAQASPATLTRIRTSATNMTISYVRGQETY